MKRIVISAILILALIFSMALSVCAAPTEFVFDEAELLSKSEEAALSETLQTISEAYEAQVAVATVSSVGDGDVDALVNAYYDGMELGYGENQDGVLLLVCMNPREFRILSNGLAGDAITMNEINLITEEITPDLSSGYYADAFTLFAEECEYYLNGYINGFPFDAGATFMLAAAVGLLTGVIVASSLKGQLKSVAKKTQANSYVKPGSLYITQSNDFFLYRNVVKTEKQQSRSSDTNSGGGSRNVGGGSF